MIRRLAIFITCLATTACDQLFGLPQLEYVDASVDTGDLDAADANVTACPATYTLALAGQSSRYRADLAPRSYSASRSTCSAELPPRTHAIAIETQAEATQVRDYVKSQDQTLRYWTSAVQMTDQQTPDAGWFWITGAPVDPVLWIAGEPNDGGSGGENGGQNHALIDPTFSAGLLEDRGASVLAGVICECEPPP